MGNIRRFVQWPPIEMAVVCASFAGIVWYAKGIASEETKLKSQDLTKRVRFNMDVEYDDQTTSAQAVINESQSDDELCQRARPQSNCAQEQRRCDRKPRSYARTKETSLNGKSVCSEARDECGQKMYTPAVHTST